MKKLFLLLILLSIMVYSNADGFFYNDPATLWGDASFGIYEDDWDLIIANPAELSGFRGMEIYTKYDADYDYEKFEIAFRKYVSDKFGGFSIYFLKENYSYGYFEDESDSSFEDWDDDGINDIKYTDYESDMYKYNWDRYSLFFDYGKEFSKDLKLGFGLAYYVSKNVYEEEESWDWKETALLTGTVSEYETWYEYYREERKSSELALDLGSVYRMNDDLTLDGVLSLKSVKNSNILTDSYSEYTWGWPASRNQWEKTTYTGSNIEDLMWDSTYSGMGLGIDLGIEYNKLKDRTLILDIGFQTVGADVEDDQYVEEYKYIDEDAFGTDIETETYLERETTTRTGTVASFNTLRISLRYQRKFGDKVRFGTGIKYLPFATMSAQYDSQYDYYERYDEDDGDGIANDYHYTYEYSASYDVTKKEETSTISFPFTFEIRSSPVMKWYIGLEHTIYTARWTEQWQLNSITAGQRHVWVDNDYDTWSEDDLTDYDESDKWSSSESYHYTYFKLGFCYNPVKNLYIEALATLRNLEIDDLIDADLKASIRYVF